MYNVSMLNVEVYKFILKGMQSFDEVNGCKSLFSATIIDQGGQLLARQQTGQRHNAATSFDNTEHDFEYFH